MRWPWTKTTEIFSVRSCSQRPWWNRRPFCACNCFLPCHSASNSDQIDLTTTICSQEFFEAAEQIFEPRIFPELDQTQSLKERSTHVLHITPPARINATKNVSPRFAEGRY